MERRALTYVINRAAFRRKLGAKWTERKRNGSIRFEPGFFEEIERGLDWRMGQLLSSGSRRTFTALDARQFF